MLSLEEQLIKAIDGDSIEELEKYISICDMLHKGICEICGYTTNDEPDDMKYEEAVSRLEELKKIREAERFETIIHAAPPPIEEYNPKTSSLKMENAKAARNTLLFMDGIEMAEIIPNLSDVILMPKFDGCSLGVKIVKNGDGFLITEAETRGTDNLNGKRNCQDKTEYLKEVAQDMINRMNEHIENPIMTIFYKDMSKLGNDNEPLTDEIDLNNIDSLIIRGEFVSNDKENSKIEGFPLTAVGLAAGTINAKDKFNVYKDYLDFVPFEIALIRIKKLVNHEEIINEYIPTQLTALKILNKLKMISYPFINVKEIDENFNMEKALSFFERKIKQPLDGVVYCVNYWTYPSNKNETSKRVNYCKYKWKRHNSKQTRLIDITYAIGKTGKITPSLIFEGVSFNNKTYKHAKTTFNIIDTFKEECENVGKVFGVGLICEMELKADMNPYISKIYPNISTITEEINILETCPYCGTELTKEIKTSNKQRIINISCSNDKCIGLLVQQLKDFFKQINFKGISDKTIMKFNYEDFAQFYNDAIKNKKEFDEIIYNLSTYDFLIKSHMFNG